MPQFDIVTYSSQLFWLVVVFGFIYITISRIIAPTAEKLLKRREGVLSDYAENTLAIVEQTEKLRQNYDKNFKELLDTVKDIKRETAEAVDKLFLEKQSVFADELNVENTNILNYERKIKAAFSEDKQTICLELADFVINKIIKTSTDKQLLQKCYYKR